jgi:large subunit ribosomal protein L6
MSRIGKKPIKIPAAVKVELHGRRISVSGPKGQLSWEVPEGITVEHDGSANLLQVTRADDEKRSRAFHGLNRALIANMVHGVERGFERELHVFGTGYSCNLQGKTLQLNIGFSGRGHNHPCQFAIPVPDGVEVEILTAAARGDTDPAKFVVRGADKQKVGQFAAEIRKLRPPEPYLGKGIRYKDEVVKRKAGKAFAGGAGG